MRDKKKLAARMMWERAGLMSMNCDWIHVVPDDSAGPIALAFQVDVLGMTYLKGMPSELTEGTHSFVISVRDTYPFIAPVVSFSTPNPPAHVNIYRNGNVCIGGWNRSEENLSTLVIRIIRCIFLMPETFNFRSVADSECNAVCTRIAERELEPPQLPGLIPIPDFGGAL